MYCPEDGTHIQPPEEVEIGELAYPPCSSCGAKWVYQGDLSIGPCYILSGWDEEAQVRWADAQIDEVVAGRRMREPNLSSEHPSQIESD